MSILCRYFVSYAHTDKKSADQLLELLRPRLKIANHVGFSEWIDHQITPGDLWRERIQAAIENSDFGLLLLSPAFFASEFIIDEELARYISQNDRSITIHKAIVPVGLKAIPLDGRANLNGLQQTQIFRDRENRWFNQLRGHSKDAFADELTAKILAKLEAAQ